MMEPIYLDNNAGTQLDPEVRDFLKSLLDRPILNPSSLHRYGQKAKSLLLSAKDSIGKRFGFVSNEVIFTAGATESLNLVIHSLLCAYPEKQILSTRIEHPALYETLCQKKAEVCFLDVGEYGVPTFEQIKSHLSGKISAMMFSAANSETGVKLEIEKVADLALRYKIPLILDATAWVGKEPFPIHPGISALCFSSFKFHGPQGVGALLVRNIPMRPLFYGGPQQENLRSGTEALFSILGMEKALDRCYENFSTSVEKTAFLRDLLEKKVAEFFPVVRNGLGPRMAHVSNLYFPEIDGDGLFIALDRQGVCVSLGSACSSGALKPSRTLLEMGFSKKRALSSIRFSLSRYTSEEEIHRTVETLRKILKEL